MASSGITRALASKASIEENIGSRLCRWSIMANQYAHRGQSYESNDKSAIFHAARQ